MPTPKQPNLLTQTKDVLTFWRPRIWRCKHNTTGKLYKRHRYGSTWAGDSAFCDRCGSYNERRQRRLLAARPESIECTEEGHCDADGYPLPIPSFTPLRDPFTPLKRGYPPMKDNNDGG